MYGEDENKKVEENGSDNESEERYGSFSSENGDDGYVRPDLNENSEESVTEETSDDTDECSGAKEDSEDAQEEFESQDYSGYRQQGNGGQINNGSYNGYYGNGMGYNRYGGNGYNGYGMPQMSRGVYDKNRNAENGAHTPEVNSAKSGKKKIGLILGAVLLCFVMCFGSVLTVMLMLRGNDVGNNNGGNGSGGNQLLDNGGNNSSGSNHSPFLGGGDVVLEQLPADSEYYTIPSVVAATQDTVVEITTEVKVTGSIFGQYVTQGAGSGVIIKSYSQKGTSGVCGTYIITNNHVIEDASSVKVTLRNGVTYDATVVAADPKTDIAVVHVNEVDLPVAKLGTSSTIVAGQTVILIGNPLGSLGGSVSSGIISSTERNIKVDNVIMRLIQTTAAVNPGNSGGAMFDLEGKLIGVVNAKYSDEQIEGIGFAIPIDTASKVAEDLINYGYVKGLPNHGISVTYGSKAYYSDFFNTYYISYDGARVSGLWVSDIESGSDAEKAGIKAYDQIRSVIANDGKTYVFNSAVDATAFFDSLSVGDTVTVNVYRYQAKSNTVGTAFERSEQSFTFTVTEYSKK